MTPKGRAEWTAAALRTTLYGRNHIAGTGISEDDYSHDALGGGKRPALRRSMVKSFPVQGKEWESMNGPVIIVQPGKRE